MTLVDKVTQFSSIQFHTTSYIALGVQTSQCHHVFDPLYPILPSSSLSSPLVITRLLWKSHFWCNKSLVSHCFWRLCTLNYLLYSFYLSYLQNTLEFLLHGKQSMTFILPLYYCSNFHYQIFLKRALYLSSTFSNTCISCSWLSPQHWG